MAQISRKITVYIDGTQVDNTLKGLQKELARLRNVQKNATLGSEEYIETTKRIARIKEIIDEQNESVKQLSKEWERAKDSAASSATLFMGAKAGIDMATGAYSRLKGAMQEYVEEAAHMDNAYSLVFQKPQLRLRLPGSMA